MCPSCDLLRNVGQGVWYVQLSPLYTHIPHLSNALWRYWRGLGDDVRNKTSSVLWKRLLENKTLTSLWQFFNSLLKIIVLWIWRNICSAGERHRSPICLFVPWMYWARVHFGVHVCANSSSLYSLYNKKYLVQGIREGGEFVWQGVGIFFQGDGCAVTQCHFLDCCQLVLKFIWVVWIREPTFKLYSPDNFCGIWPEAAGCVLLYWGVT